MSGRKNGSPRPVPGHVQAGIRVDFFIVGAPKAGTTWLYRNIGRSPDLFVAANKEPRYFSVEDGAEVAFVGPGDDSWMGHFVRSRADYEALFDGAGEGRLRGEASSDYLYTSAVAAPRIRRECPAARIIVMLRDPVHRAYSNWLHHRRDGREPLPFGAALDAEEERIGAGWAWWWHYRERGWYSRQLEPFLEHFPADQILLLRHDDLRRDPQGLLRRVGDFLEVDVLADGDLLRGRNESVLVRSPFHRTVRRVARPNAVARALLPRPVRATLRRRVDRGTLHKPTIPPEDYRRLRRFYAADIERLAGMVDLDLSEWG
ncbi:MAG TPA: sulfotransferase [Solirubrobacterales bacterium]|nr:sulfotransferase [Solirubrobacterales bacterium]